MSVVGYLKESSGIKAQEIVKELEKAKEFYFVDRQRKTKNTMAFGPSSY